MKIQNKVNNVIYGTLMLLPVLAVGFSCLITTFNKNVNNVQNANIEYYPTNEINDYNDFIVGNYYTFDYSISAENIELDNEFYFLQDDGLFKILDFNISFTSEHALWLTDLDNFTFDYLVFFATYNDEYLYQLNYDGKDDMGSLFEIHSISLDDPRFVLTIQCLEKPQGYDNFVDYTYKYNAVQSATISDFNNIDTFYYALNKVSETPVFNWAKNSFVYQPLNRFATIFGANENSFIALMLSYWVSVSLIWFGYEVLTFMITFARNSINKFTDKSGGF